MLCDVGGSESPLPLVISALGVGPLVQLLYDTIGMVVGVLFAV
jgi:hypothetical protein